MSGSKIVALSAGALAVASSAMAALQINTPTSLLTCEPAQLSWTGSNAPYFVSVLPGGQASGTPLEQFGQQSSTSLTWNVDIASGTSVTISLTDSTGAQAFSDAVTVGKGTSDDCVGKSASVSAGASTAAAASGSSSAASSAAATSAAASGSSAAPASASASSDAAAASGSSDADSAAGSTFVSRAGVALAAAGVVAMLA